MYVQVGTSGTVGSGKSGSDDTSGTPVGHFACNIAKFS